MTAGVATARDRSALAVARAWMRDRPLVPLLGLLLVLVLVLHVAQPGILTAGWASTTLRFAIPLAIIAACQTLTMLTGGIDLSVAVVASMTAYVMATLVSDFGWVGALVIAIALGFFIFMYSTTGVGKGSGGYHLTAKFKNVEGINVGSDIRMSGIKIGSPISTRT